MQAHPIAAFSREKPLGFTAAPTFEEYLVDAAGVDVLRHRMAEIRIGPDEQLFFVTYPDVLHWVVLVGDDSPDTVAVLPVLMHLARYSPRIDVRVVQVDAWEDQLRVLVDDSDVFDSLADSRSAAAAHL